MMRKLGVCFLVFAMCMLPAMVFAGTEIVEIGSREEAAGGEGGAGERVDRVLCVSGMKVYQTVVFGVGNGSGSAVSNIQLYEERDGKVVPMTCKMKVK